MPTRLFTLPRAALLTTACVTINLYFPAAAAEEAARTIVRDVLQGEAPASAPATPPAASGDQSSLRGGLDWRILAGRLLEMVVPPAQAAQADININTPAIRSIRAGMQKRQQALAPFYGTGAIGFDRRGDVAVRDLAQASLADRNRLKKLVADENADRARLYREIAAANGHPEWAEQVRDTFSKVWIDEAPRGYWYQDAGGSWRQR